MEELRPERLSHLCGVLLRPVILGHLLCTSAYGYELRGRLLAVGVECDLGTVYRALNMMEVEGLLCSSWERSTCGRSRRRYELSEVGVRMVETYAGAVEQLVGVANAFIQMHRAAASFGGSGICETVPVTHDASALQVVNEKDGRHTARADRSVDARSLTGTMRPLRILPVRRPANRRVGALGAT